MQLYEWNTFDEMRRAIYLQLTLWSFQVCYLLSYKYNILNGNCTASKSKYVLIGYLSRHIQQLEQTFTIADGCKL